MSSDVFLPDEAPDVAPDARACPFCGETIKAVARKCRHCGELLGDPTKPGLFRHGKKLVVSRTAPLPARCIKTGEPTDRYLTREVTWHHPLVYILLVTGILPYLIAAIFVRKKHRLRVPLSAASIKRRRIGLAIAWIGSLGGLAAIIGGGIAMEENESLGAIVLLAGIAAFIVGIVAAIVYSNPLTATRIDDEHLWLKGAGKSYLADLPDWPGK